jgi:hypothetical protein
VIIVSYLFIFAGAWNDGLIGLLPSVISASVELLMAVILVLEILSRALFTERRGIGFYSLFLLDLVSLLTIVPALTGFAFARFVRLIYASWRTTALIECIADKKNNAMYLVWIYPLVLPLAAALLYAIESQSPHAAVNNYLDALGMTIGYSLTLGTDHPHTYAGNILCGTMFVGGVLCISIIGNSLAQRYAPETDNTA